MEKIEIVKTGKPKEVLLNCMERMQAKFSNFKNEYNISIKRNDKIFFVSANKMILFLNFRIKAKVTVQDEKIIIEYETNAPQRYHKEAIDFVTKAIKEECF